MADGDLILKIDPDLAERFRPRAEAAGQTVRDYVLGILRRAVEEPGFEENEARWDAAAPSSLHANGFSKRDAAYWEEMQRISDETERDGGIPWEQVEARLLSFGQKR